MSKHSKFMAAISMSISIFLLVSVSVRAAAEELEEISSGWKIKTQSALEITMGKDGKISAGKVDGDAIILFAGWRAKVEAGGKSFQISSTDLAPWGSEMPVSRTSGSKTVFSLRARSQEPPALWSWKIMVQDSMPGFTIQLSVKNQGDEDMIIRELSPLRAENENGGGAFVGSDPAQTWILENGYKYTMDFWVRLLRGNSQSISDWNWAAFDPGSGRTLLGGFLTDNIASTIQVRSSYTEGQGIKDGNRTALTAWSAVATYAPNKTLPPEQELESELFYVDFLSPTPQQALETFADAVAQANSIKIWPGLIPTGWSSWYSGYYNNNSEDTMLMEAGVAKDKLQAFGLTTFQIDSMWPKAVGDWTAASDRFPRGLEWFIGRLRDMDFKMTGVWIAPFVAGKDSDLIKQHPDWIVKPNSLARTLMPKDWEILDLSHPEVKKWLRNLFAGFKKAGVNWLKIDFIYYALLGEDYYDKTKTNVEIFRDALKIIRDAAGGDTFIMLIAVPIETGVGYGDGMRLGLDMASAWNDSEDYLAQGVKPAYIYTARRYYLNHRVWINHPDTIYLGVEDEEQGRWGNHITLNEGRFYATVLGLTGGITKAGNKFSGLDDQRIDILRRVLPPIRVSARPMDLFEMRYPEVWDLPVLGAGLDYHAVGLFNWGQNARWGVPVPEEKRTIGIDLDKIGLEPRARYHAFGFWGRKYLGLVSGRIELDLPPRELETVFLTPAGDKPVLIGTNRHVAGFMTHVKEIAWEDTKTLKVLIDADPGFDYQLTFFAPDGFEFKEARASNPGGGWKPTAAQTPAPGGKLLSVGFNIPRRETVTLLISFK